MNTSLFISAGNKIKPYRDASAKYGWLDGSYGLAVPEAICYFAIQEDKHVLLKVTSARAYFAVSPEDALEVANRYNAYFTARDGRLFIVVPKSICYRVDKETNKVLGKKNLPKGEKFYE